MAETVLVADDEAEDLAFLSGLLEKDGFTVRQASSGAKALELLEAWKFDLVITDLVMPGASGFEVIQAAQRLHPEAICLALTGHGSLDSAIDALRMGAYSYLLKPCDETGFRHCIQRGLEKQRLTKELRLRNQELEALNRDLDSKVQKATQELTTLSYRMLTEMASLKEIDELKTSFLNHVSHDLKNPLTTIRGYLELFTDDPKFELNAEVRDCLMKVRKATSHMEYLISQLLEAAKVSSGTVKLERVRVPLAELAQEAIALLQIQADASGLKLELRLDPSAPSAVQADRGRLLQILSNLLGNACKFTPKGGKVTLHVALTEGRTRFCVEDTGPGIAPEHQGRIFEKFYQVDRSASRPFKGLGLGLRIAKDLVELHGGRIWIESQPGKGSRFYFDLP
ncbi:MAG: response regulator [Elusimicrobia bacterium]|nr:response regulator [Elusimicrobiota bacterium]